MSLNKDDFCSNKKKLTHLLNLLFNLFSVNETLESLGDKFNELIEDNSELAGADTTLCKFFFFSDTRSIVGPFGEKVVFIWPFGNLVQGHDNLGLWPLG